MASVAKVLTKEAILDGSVQDAPDSLPSRSRLESYKDRLIKAAVFAGTVGAAAGFALSGVGKASAGRESPGIQTNVDLDTGSRVQLVCARPEGVPFCDIDRVREAGAGTLNFLKHPDHGAPGFSIRYVTKNNERTVISLQLDETVSEIENMYSSAPIALYGSITNQVHEKVNNDTEITKAVFVTGLPRLTKCSPASNWNGTSLGFDTLVQNLSENCDSKDPYDGYRAPHARMLNDIIHNDGWVQPCAEDFIDSNDRNLIGYSNDPKSLLKKDVTPNWFEVLLTKSIFDPGRHGGCKNLADDNPRFAWDVHTSVSRSSVSGSSIGPGVSSNQGRIELMSPADEVLTLDPGNRLPVGTVVEPRYKPAAGEEFTGWSGICMGKETCQFVVNQVINLQANTKQLPQQKLESVVIEVKRKIGAKGIVKVIGDMEDNNVNYPSDSIGAAPKGTTVRLTASTSNRNLKLDWDNIDCVREVATAAGRVCITKAGVKATKKNPATLIVARK